MCILVTDAPSPLGTQSTNPQDANPPGKRQDEPSEDPNSTTKKKRHLDLRRTSSLTTQYKKINKHYD